MSEADWAQGECRRGAELCLRWELARGWAYTLLVCNGFLVLWFGFLAACRVASQRGSVSADEDDEDEGEDDSSDDDLCRMGL